MAKLINFPQAHHLITHPLRYSVQEQILEKLLEATTQMKETSLHVFPILNILKL
jgi:hypothetical protein